jgi:hypothetical protein
LLRDDNEFPLTHQSAEPLVYLPIRQFPEALKRKAPQFFNCAYFLTIDVLFFVQLAL